MGHRLHQYNGICRSLHGHNVTVEVHCDAEEFLDFKVVHAHLKGVLDDFDHAMVLFAHDPLAKHLLEYKHERIRIVLLTHEPSTENIAAYVYHAMKAILPEVFHVRVHETEKYSASTSITADVPLVRRVD